MKLVKKVVIGSCLVVSLGGAMAMPAGAASRSGPPPGAQSVASPGRPMTVLVPGWNFGGYYASERNCVIAKELRRTGGYPVEPASGCYRDPNGYYYLWYTN